MKRLKMNLIFLLPFLTVAITLTSHANIFKLLNSDTVVDCYSEVHYYSTHCTPLIILRNNISNCPGSWPLGKSASGFLSIDPTICGSGGGFFCCAVLRESTRICGTTKVISQILCKDQ